MEYLELYTAVIYNTCDRPSLNTQWSWNATFWTINIFLCTYNTFLQVRVDSSLAMALCFIGPLYKYIPKVTFPILQIILNTSLSPNSSWSETLPFHPILCLADLSLIGDFIWQFLYWPYLVSTDVAVIVCIWVLQILPSFCTVLLLGWK